MSLALRVIAQSAVFFVGLGVLLFWPAGSLRWGEAWAFLATLGAITTAISGFLFARDKKLLERRLALAERGEAVGAQRVLQGLAGVSFFGMLVVCGLDHRYGWSALPLPVIALGYALVLVGYFLVYRVFRENTYTSAVIEVAEGQTVVSTGPYAHVRHPMYSGGILAIVGTPLALGSVVALALSAVLILVIVARLRNEERYLSEHLTGYTDYLGRVRYRLVPHMW